MGKFYIECKSFRFWFNSNFSNFLQNRLNVSNAVIVLEPSKSNKMLLYDLYHYISDLPRWHIFAIFLVGYFVYYLIEVVKVCLFALHIELFKFDKW